MECNQVAKLIHSSQSNKSELSGLVNSLTKALDTLQKPMPNNQPKRGAKRKNTNASTQKSKRQRVDGQDLRSAPVSLGYVQPPVGMRSAAPSRPGGEVRIVGCDYIGPVTAETTATDNVFSLKADNSSTFPRMSAIASIFGKYAYNKLKIYVIGKAASTLPGDQTSVTVYESGGLTALTESQVKNRFGQVTSKFWENHLHIVDTKKASVPWFVLSTVNNDQDVEYFGYYHLFTEAVTATSATADVFIEYDVEFCEAKAIGDAD